MSDSGTIDHPEHGFVPPGHYYSPIPDWLQVRRDAARIFAPATDSIPGIDMNRRGQLEFLEQIAVHYASMPFGETKSEAARYYLDNQSYAYCDGIVLYCVLRHLKPRRLIEVGSGFSSCVALDVNQKFPDSPTQLTFIEPFPEVLRSLLRPGDLQQTRLIESRLQDVELSLFDELQAGDVVFIDSTHVSKIGSDVNRIVFEILPRLAPGVHVHIHDVFYPFEYPSHWVYNGQAWNELYLLRAFLQYNAAFEIMFMSSYMGQFEAERLAALLPLAMRNTGGNLWLRKAV